MTDPNELRKQSTAFHHESEMSKTLVLAADTIEGLTAERDALKLDAERYAKAYQHHHLGINGRICAICQFDVTDPIHIRAAIAKEKTT